MLKKIEDIGKIMIPGELGRLFQLEKLEAYRIALSAYHLRLRHYETHGTDII